MGWGTLIGVPHEYNEDVKRIDEAMLRLLAERKRLTGRKRFYPSRDVLQLWADELGLELDTAGRFLHQLNERLPVMPQREETPTGVLPLMKRSSAMGCEFLITHAIQYEASSQLTVDITYTGNEEGARIDLRPQLELAVLGGGTEYDVRSRGANGGASAAQLRFLITPRLPDDVAGIAFALVPAPAPFLPEHHVVKLDQAVYF